MRISSIGAVVAGAFVPGDIEVSEGRIDRIGLPSTGSGYVLPGLIDLQANGYAGVDFNAAEDDEIDAALGALLRDGVFAVQAAVITDSEDNVRRQLGRFGAAMQRRAPGARVVGVHAEGPFLSPHHRGVHRTEFLRDPDIAIIDRFLEAGPLRTITVAPELDGAIDLIRQAAARGVIVQAGHSGADPQTSYAAFDAGARGVTHLFNGMIAFGHRAPGIAGATLSRSDVAIQLIADDIHISREAAEMALRAAEDRIMLVTDASSAAAAGDGSYTVGGFSITVRDGVPRLPDGTLAGSTVRLIEQVQKLVQHGWRVDRAVNLASRAPARFFGLHDEGELRVGGPADLIVTDAGIGIDRVLVAGEEVTR